MMNGKFIKMLALSLALVMIVAAFAACKAGDDSDQSTSSSGTQSGTDVEILGVTAQGHNLVKFVDDGKTYSYRMAPSSLPTSWNSHTYKSNDGTYILDYATDSLYTYEFNSDFTGFEIVPSMAADYPEDVTSEYVGQYGVKEGDVNKVWKITLKDNLKYDNGEAINAQSFVDSMKLLLNPEAANFRADTMWMYDLKIVGSEAYAKGGTYALGEFVSAAFGEDEYVDPSEFSTTEDGVYQLERDGKVYDVVLDINNGGNWGEGLSVFKNAGYLDSVSEAYGRLEAAADSKGWVKLNADLLKDLQNCIAALQGYESVEAYAEDKGDYAYQEFEEMAYLGRTWEKIEYDGNVGFLAPSELELVVVLINPMEDNFYLRKELSTDFFLVYTPLYEDCIKNDNGVYANTYGTSVDTYVGFGPYKLTEYKEGASIVLERNMNWHGYSDGEYIQGTYMTDRVVYSQVKEDSTRLEMFLKGEIDTYTLMTDDMADYSSSSQIYYTDSESTWYLAMNPQLANLTTVQATAQPVNTGYSVNKTVLTIQEFRQALSYSLDRKQFNQTLSPTSGVAKALLSSFIVADPESGLTYRAMDEAKDVILSFWGLSDAWGEGKEYATRDEAIDSITGYDPSGAKTLFDQAYDKAVEQGLLTEEQISSGKWEVQIVIGKPSEAAFYNDGFEFLKTTWTEAVKGTKFEGHLAFVQSSELGSTTFGEYLRNGQVDILFGVGYAGDQFNPYAMLECFTGSLEYDPFTDKNAISVDIEIDGQLLRASLYNWVSQALMGTEIEASVVDSEGNTTSEKVKINAGTSAPASMRVAILAKCEEAIMNIANIFPVQTDASAALRCLRIEFVTDEYVTGMGFGGLEWNKYIMDDAEFANAVSASEDGILDYKS